MYSPSRSPGRTVVSDGNSCANPSIVAGRSSPVRRADPIFEPGRAGGYPANHRRADTDSRLIATSYDEVPANFECDSLAICLSGEPSVQTRLPPCVSSWRLSHLAKCASCLYRSRRQLRRIGRLNKSHEQMVSEARTKQERTGTHRVRLPSDVDVMILRPRVLSFDTIPWNPISTSRRDLARSIVDWSSAKLWRMVTLSE